MREGRLSTLVRGGCPFVAAPVARAWAHLSMAPSGGEELVGVFAPVAQFHKGPSGGQGGRGACRSEGAIGCEHPPDRLAEPAGDLDRGDLRAALAAVAGAHALDDRPIVRV